MSIQPRKLCKLQKGKALGAFDTFVDTFNWMVDFCANLIGEGEESSSEESDLRIDRTVSDRPVIRGGWKGGGGGMTDIRLSEDETYIQVFVDGEWVNKIPTIKHSEI